MSNIFLFHGEDTFSSKEKLKGWKKEFSKKYGEEAIETYEANNLSLGEFLTNLHALPFFIEKKMIILKNLFNEGKTELKEKITETLENIPDFCIFILHENGNADKRTSLYKKIAQNGKVENFDQLKPEQIAQKISKQHNISLSTANYLIEYCGSEMWTLNQEISKLKTLGEKITPLAVQKICTPSLSASIFTLMDHLSTKQTERSLKTLKNLNESGEDLIKVFFMMVRNFRILIQIKYLLDSGKNEKEIQSILKQHPFVIKKSIQQCKNFSMEKLKIIYQNLLKIDTDFKTGVIKTYGSDNKEYQLAIEKLIINCC